MKYTGVLLLSLILINIYNSATAQGSRVWATYYGGAGVDLGNCVSTDVSGNVYLAGRTNSDTGIARGGVQNTLGGMDDAFLVKFDVTGKRLWATYYGGTGEELASSVAIDASGNVYLAGNASSGSGIASGGFQNSFGGFTDAFLAKFNAAGTLLWATYYGGAGEEHGNSISLDASGNIYLAGATSSASGISSGGFQNSLSGNYDAFLVKFDANGNRLWATYYGGAGDEYGHNVATDTSSGNVYLTGKTYNSSNLASGGFQNTPGGGWDAFLVKFDSGGNRLWATYYGETGLDFGNSLTVDVSGNIYMSGETSNISGIASGGHQNTFGGGVEDDYLVKFDASGNRLWATYYGGNGGTMSEEIGFDGLTTDADGNVFMAGDSYSSNNIASGGYQNSLAGKENLFLATFSDSGSRFCATYYGQGVLDNENGCVALGEPGHVYLGGCTNGTSGIASGGHQNTFGGGTYDAIVVKFASCAVTVLPPVAGFQSSDTTFCAYDCINFTDLSTNTPTSWQWSFPGGTPASSANQNPQNICYLNSGTYPVTLTAVNAGGSNTITLTNFITVIAAPPTPIITQTGDTLHCSTDPGYTSYQWYDSTTIVPGATDTLYVITHDGNYNVKVTNSNGCSIAVGINVTIIPDGVQSFELESCFTISPNPVGNQLTIHDLRFTSGHCASCIVHCELFNMLGQVYHQSEIKNPQFEISIDVSALAKGIYFVKVENENSRYVRKFVKE